MINPYYTCSYKFRRDKGFVTLRHKKPHQSIDLGGNVDFINDWLGINLSVPKQLNVHIVCTKLKKYEHKENFK